MLKTGPKRFFQKSVSILIILAGLLLLGYPWFSNYLYENRTDSIVNIYEQTAENLDRTEINRMLDQARQYNEQLSSSKAMLTDPFAAGTDQEDENDEADSLKYENMLSEDDTGIMCFLEIPEIDVYLPVYHGTSTEVLEKGIGHIEGSSLPIGGIGNHAVLSGHTGVNSAKLFTDLTEMEEGDYFFLHVLGDTLAYQVISINVIEPEDTGKLSSDPDKDLVSLLTCTPYGVNTHRLVVTGQRCDYTPEVYAEAKEEEKSTGSLWMQSYRKAILIGLAISAGCFTIAYFLAFLLKLRRKDAGR